MWHMKDPAYQQWLWCKIKAPLCFKVMTTLIYLVKKKIQKIRIKLYFFLLPKILAANEKLSGISCQVWHQSATQTIPAVTFWRGSPKNCWWHKFVIIKCMNMKHARTHLQPVHLPWACLPASVRIHAEERIHVGTWHSLPGLDYTSTALSPTHLLTVESADFHNFEDPTTTTSTSTWMLLLPVSPHPLLHHSNETPQLSQSHLMTLMWRDWYSRLTRHPLHLTAVFTSPYN